MPLFIQGMGTDLMKTLPFLFLLFELVASSSCKFQFRELADCCFRELLCNKFRVLRLHSACSSDGSTSCGESTGYCDPSSVDSADDCNNTDMADSE